MKQRDIYIANLNPGMGREQKGMRPVVIVSGDAMNGNLGLSLICPISSKIKNYAACVPLKKNRLNMLKQKSEIITFQIRTISQKRLRKKVGEISQQELEQVFKGLADVLKY